MMSQEIEKLATEEKDVVFLKVNIVINTEDMSKSFYIKAIPTFILIKDGAMIDVVRNWKVGKATLHKLKEAINKHKSGTNIDSNEETRGNCELEMISLFLKYFHSHKRTSSGG